MMQFKTHSIGAVRPCDLEQRTRMQQFIYSVLLDAINVKVKNRKGLYTVKGKPVCNNIYCPQVNSDKLTFPFTAFRVDQ